MTVTSGGTVQLWDSQSGAKLFEPLRMTNRTTRARFSSDGTLLVIASAGVATFVDPKDGKFITTPTSDGEFGWIASIHFRRDGLRAVTTYANNTVSARIWDTRLAAIHRELATKTFGRIHDTHFTEDGVRFLSSPSDYSMRILNPETGEPVAKEIRTDQEDGSGSSHVELAKFSGDGNRIVAVLGNYNTIVWDVKTGLRECFPLPYTSTPSVLRFSPGGQHLLVGCTDGGVHVWDMPAIALPIPTWFLDWAEARAGRRIDADGNERTVPAEEQLRQYQLAAARTETDFFTRLAQWIQADPGGRTNAWFAP